MARIEKKLLIEYLLATKNEIAVDRSVYALAGILPEQLGCAPRPSKLLSISRRSLLLSTAMKAIRVLWSNGGAILFFMLQWRALRSKVAKGIVDEPPRFDCYTVCYSSRAMDLITPQLLGQELYKITLPWVESRHDGGSTLGVLKLLNQSDLRNAFIHSVVASRKLRASKKYSCWSLQSYTAFRWFCVRLALRRLSAKKLVIAEHYDRWAVLSDRVVLEACRNNFSDDAGLVMVQHGALVSLESNKLPVSNEFSVKLAYRLRSVTRLYTFNEDAVATFETSILSALSPLRAVGVCFYSPALKLAKVAPTSLPSLLFVGHPLCEELHIQILQAIGPEVQSFYKPHPANPATNRISSMGWNVITQKDVFPDVDLLISYPSTLVAEYEGMHIPAIIHPLNMPPAEAGELIASIRRSIALAAKR
ncbi:MULTISPECIES: hypothetical protein [Pseudomonas]|uniref:hypothetical protein n=1 Tax=Pseudomonas TaxID=286 RepID=UPI00117A1A80|nr:MULTISPECIES: hypothetical protein [Pseudomonas]MBS9761725.1 hypothetical protein [Pseudomonas mosselii]